MCPSECVWDISGEAPSKRRNQQRDWWTPGSSTVARLAAMVVADIKKEQPRQNRGE